MLSITGYQTFLNFESRSVSKSELTILRFEITHFDFESRSISKTELGLIQFGKTLFDFEARSINRTSFFGRNGGELELTAKSKSKTSFGLRIIRNENTPFVLTVRTAPMTRGLRHKDLYEFKVDGVDVPISDYTVDFPPNSAGCLVNVTLSKFADKSLITPNAVYKFNLGKIIGGEEVWRTVINSGEYQSSRMTIGFGDRRRSDSFSLSTVEPLADRLGKKPLRNLVIYDPFRVSVNASDFPVKYDTEGNKFTTELLAIPNLSVKKLFQEIFVNRCGFTSVKTNLSDETVKELTFPTGRSYLEGISGIIGSYEPDFALINNDLFIRDTTLLNPPGFPAPVELSADDYQASGISQTKGKIDCFNLIYTEDADDWDFYETEVEELPVEISGTPGLDDYSQTTITRLTKKFYRNSQPNVPIKEDMFQEIRETRDSSEVTGKVTESFFYDAFGRPYLSRKKVESRVPAFDDGELTVLSTVRETETKISYGKHPFEPAKQVELGSLEITKGQYIVDEENPYNGKPFKQPVIVANRSGNITDGSTSAYGPIEKITATLQILPNDQVRTVTRKEDLLAKNVEFDYSAVKYGEASSLEKGRTRELYVFENPGDTFTGQGEEDFPVGQMSLTTAIPLARRKLKKRKSGSYNLDISLIGLELFLDRGMDFTVLDEKDSPLGAFTVKGFKFAGNNLGTINQAHSTSWQGGKI